MKQKIIMEEIMDNIIEMLSKKMEDSEKKAMYSAERQELIEAGFNMTRGLIYSEIANEIKEILEKVKTRLDKEIYEGNEEIKSKYYKK